MKNKQRELEAETTWEDAVPIIKEGQHTDVYLTSAIEEPWEYNQLCYVLDHAYPSETFTLHINNYGGFVDSGFMIIAAIKNSEAHITAKLSGTVASVATIITLACDKYVLTDHLAFMIHNYSGGAQGKGHEIKAQVDFTDSELNTAFTSIYGGFLTDNEMELVIAGKDYWLNKGEVLARLAARESKDTAALEAIAAKKKAKR